MAYVAQNPLSLTDRTKFAEKFQSHINLLLQIDDYLYDVNLKKDGCMFFAHNRLHRLIFATVVCILAVLGAPAYAMDSSAALDNGLDLYDDRRYKNTESALLELMSDSSFRRLDTSQKALLYSHIAYSKIKRGLDRESLPYIDKALSETKREFGEKSLPYLDHMRTKAVAVYWDGQVRNARRVAEDIDNRLERMGDDYKEERDNIRSMISAMYKSRLEEEELPQDFSDFYTACESIEPGMSLSQASSVMRKYSLVGKQYKPDHKQSNYFKNTYLKHARESSSERRNRLIYIHDKEHLHDWCVLYKDGKTVRKTAISAKDDK